MLFDFKIIKSKAFDIPVVSVGNLSAGGTGKTPFIEYLAGLLSKDFNVATLSRGYKRNSKGFIIADENSDAGQIGDEPMQIHKKFPDITVSVDRKRVHGIEKLMERKPQLNVVLLDDAFQHRYVKPGLSILLIDYNNPLWEDSFLPYGRLRENPVEKRRANIVVVTKCPVKMKPIDQRIILKELKLFAYQKLFFTVIKYLEMKPVFRLSGERLSDEICKTEKYSILIVTGIASSRSLRKHIRSISPHIQEIKFKDHHNYNYRDIEQVKKTFDEIENPLKLIITTEKDSTRLQKFNNIAKDFKDAWYYIPIETVFLNDEAGSFNKYIVDYVTKNRRDNILASGKA